MAVILGVVGSMPCAADLATEAVLGVPEQRATNPAGQGRVLVELVDDAGRSRSVRAELALDVQARARGLMFRRRLDPGEGMLFVFPRTAPVRMWMRNTLLSLDLLFFDATGLLVSVVPRCEPLSEHLIGPPVPVRAVLELPAGEAERMSLQPGARLIAPKLERLRAR